MAKQVAMKLACFDPEVQCAESPAGPGGCRSLAGSQGPGLRAVPASLWWMAALTLARANELMPRAGA